MNNATGATREVVSGADGAATVSALPLTGTYTVTSPRPGFTADDVTDLTLRAGETATVKVKLVASGGKTEVTVYGTTQGVRADPQIGRRLDSPTIDETPILGRKVTTLPLFNSAFRQGKGTGDLFVNATYFVTGAGQPAHDDLHARRREQRRGVGPADDAGHRAGGRGPGNLGALERVLGRVRLDGGPRAEHRDQVRHERVARRGALPGPPRRHAGEDVLDRRLLPTVRRRAASRRRRSTRSTRPTCLTN